MKIEHFLVVVVIFCITIFLVIVLAGPPKNEKCSGTPITCPADEVAVCDDGVWKCKGSKGKGDFVYIEPVDNESCYPNHIATVNSPQSISIPELENWCLDKGYGCAMFKVHSSGANEVMPYGPKDSNKISGFRLSPFGESNFKRVRGIDMSDPFKNSGNYTKTTYNITSVDACEQACFDESSCKNPDHTCTCSKGGYGYVYDTSTQTCDIYTTNQTSNTSKYLKKHIY